MSWIKPIEPGPVPDLITKSDPAVPPEPELIKNVRTQLPFAEINVTTRISRKHWERYKRIEGMKEFIVVIT